MTYFDGMTGHAMAELDKGNHELLAALFDRGRTIFLHEYLRDRPDRCERIARMLRGKSARGPGEKPAAEERDNFILKRTCYWLGRDVLTWGDGGEGAAIRKAAEEWKGPKQISGDSAKSHIWYKRAPGAPQLLSMGAEFCKGCHEIADQQDNIEEFFHRKTRQVQELGIPPEFYASELVKMLFHNK